MEEFEGHPSLQSIQHIRPSELYPKSSVISEDKQLAVPFTPLCGEYACYLGRTSNGILALSNYRLYHQTSSSFQNIPLGLIEQVEVKDIIYLHVYCKDARLYRLTFETSELALEWMRRLIKSIPPPKHLEDVFAFALYAWASEEGSEELLTKLSKEKPSAAVNNFKNEVERLEFDTSETGPWRISLANIDYRLSPTYPAQLLVPACITDQGLDAAAKFRSTRRVPAVVWRHRGNGAVIARCSQPEVGWLGWRSGEDEQLLRSIPEACLENSPNNAEEPKKLLIMDARSYTTAVANRARGGGCECPEYYPNCDIEFMSLANIHAIRKSFSALRAICCPTFDQPNWYSQLEGTRWLQNMSGLLHAAITVASAIENDARPVLVHCSDGWDRTPQIVSLAQLLLDPYYRTIEGFRVLVEKEWLEFGHKFADRCGHIDDPNERCPVFLQWLDCVHNLVKQFPCAFQLNGNYLVKLAQHTYSNMFGTFLCNNSRERMELNIAARTYSVWSFLNQSQYYNHLYTSQEKVLWPSCNIRDLHLWRELYLGSSSAVENIITQQAEIYSHQDNNANAEAEFMNGEDLNGNGDEQNGELEEYDFRTKEKAKFNEDQNIVSSKIIGEIRSVWDDGLEPKKGNQEDVVDGEASGDGIARLSVEPSVESSTETLVPSNVEGTLNRNFLERDEDSPDPNCGRNVPALLDPVDGLTPLKDEIQQRLAQIVLEHKAKETAFERELQTTRLALLQQVCHQCNHPNQAERLDDDITNAMSHVDDGVSQGSVCSTEVSWEAVEEQETMPTLWVPDHAVSHCYGCNTMFWLGRRKHHCRSCGRIFCADCSENAIALPEEQLYEPVRVCSKCYNNPLTTTCKQAAGSEGQALLPPAHTHA